MLVIQSHLVSFAKRFYFFFILPIAKSNDMDFVSFFVFLFDEINTKGFEGDMFLNGLAEHIRNLMICQDARVAALLDLPDNTRNRYHQQSQAITFNYLVNALSVINQAEIHYKQARNKRLHVELLLIKLNYLQDAVEVLQNEQGEWVKKKSWADRYNPCIRSGRHNLNLLKRHR